MKKAANPARIGWFSSVLLLWNQNKNGRQMPWKGEKDPYRIWISEIILQQTRVEQGLSYYQKFIERFPNIMSLARASDVEVFKLWEGLGYYSRCRNLLITARNIAEKQKGIFPCTYKEILKLKGVGPYTAAAISSFAFDLPHAVLDGNVFRVLARITGKSIPVDSNAGKKYFTVLANQWLDKKQPGKYNQAIMDFGATVCKPVNPLCDNCPFQNNCSAFLKNNVSQLPVKVKQVAVRKRWFYYFILQHGNKIAVVQRNEKDIWQGLYEFPLWEADEDQSLDHLLKKGKSLKWIGRLDEVRTSGLFRQQLSHQQITGRFISVNLKHKPSNEDWKWMTFEEMKRIAFPRFINSFLENQN